MSDVHERPITCGSISGKHASQFKVDHSGEVAVRLCFYNELEGDIASASVPLFEKDGLRVVSSDSGPIIVVEGLEGIERLKAITDRLSKAVEGQNKLHAKAKV